MITNFHKKYIEDLTELELEDFVMGYGLPHTVPFDPYEWGDKSYHELLNYAHLVYAGKLRMSNGQQ